MHRKMCCGGGEVGAGKKMHGEGRAAGTGEAREEEEGGGEGAKEETRGKGRQGNWKRSREWVGERCVQSVQEGGR
jgi:hypothetical protein